MYTKTVTAIAVAASVLALSTTAEAGGKRHSRHFGNNHIHFSWGGHNDYDHDFTTTPRCRYFFRKARHTGKRFWWKKYRRCISYNRHY